MHPNVSSEMGRSRIEGFHRQADRDRLGRSATSAPGAQSQSRRSIMHAARRWLSSSRPARLWSDKFPAELKRMTNSRRGLTG
jgi:hypothetical protein